VLEKQLVELIKNRETEMSQRWYRDLHESRYVPTMHNVSEDEGLRIATSVYRNLCDWLVQGREVDMKDTYQRFGESVFHRGFDMEEVVMLLVLLKRNLYLHLLELGLMTTNLNIYQALELNNKVVLYFDRAIYFGLIGYQDAKSVVTA
jgi:hypothetical protein